MDTLPTIKQILTQADRIGDTPMDEDSAREWFNQTVRDNRERISVHVMAGNKKGEGKWLTLSRRRSG